MNRTNVSAQNFTAAQQTSANQAWDWRLGQDLSSSLKKSNGSEQSALSIGRRRLTIIAAFLMLAYLLVGGRLVYLGLGSTASKPEAAQLDIRSQHLKSPILDRDGRTLAQTLKVPSAYVNIQEVRDPIGFVDSVAAVLGDDFDRQQLLNRLGSDAKFAWIQRGITPEQKHQLNWEGLIGLQFMDEQRRVYPHASLTAHTVGFNDIDNKGLAGLERSLDGQLSEIDEPQRSSIDLRLQHIVSDELDKKIQEFDAKAGAGVMMDVHTGEVLAMVSLPTYDPHAPEKASEEQRFNRAAQGVYELGSVFKLFTVAMALDEGIIQQEDKFDISRPLTVGNRVIRDAYPKNALLNAEEILERSSNIGAAQIGLKVGGVLQRDFLDRFGFLTASPLQIEEVGDPLVPDHWRTIRTATISYGHGLSVSPVQLATGISTLVNGGYAVKPTLLKIQEGQRIERRPVISHNTSQIMRHLMEQTVVEGTGRKAAVSGYRVGGKTGTAEKSSNGGYNEDLHIATFAAAFPIDNPQYALVIVVDEPKSKDDVRVNATAGVVAAPISKNVIARSVSILGIPPSQYANSQQDTFWQLMNHEIE